MIVHVLDELVPSPVKFAATHVLAGSVPPVTIAPTIIPGPEVNPVTLSPFTKGVCERYTK